jgi:hypothetical protein
MRKLKVGDKVKINEIGLPGCVNKIGDIGVITEIDHLKHARVQVGDLLSEHNWSKLSDLELIKNKMKITKQEVKEIAELLKEENGHSANHIRVEITKNILPHLFPKAKLKVGEWYRRKGDKSIFKITTHEEDDKYNGYGLDLDGEWFHINDCGYLFYDKLLVLATEEEVKEALINQCKKLGIWEVPVKCLSGLSSEKSRFGIIFHDNRLWSTYGVVFQNGVFAEPLPIKKEMTVSQLEKELGYEIEIIK